MPPALAPEQRLEIVDRYRKGETLTVIARDLGIHYETARKWARAGRRQGRQAVAHRPRKPIGQLKGVPSEVVACLLQLREQHPSWGVPYLREQLLRHPQLSQQQQAQVPSQSTLYRFLRSHEDRVPRVPLKSKVPTTPLLRQVCHPHHMWQMDLKEKCRLEGLDCQVTVANVRDVYSSVTVGAVVFALSRRNATLCGADMQDACRECFSTWGLPDILRTDKGTCFMGNFAQTSFPSAFTLWLAGLDVKHETIAKGKVTQNGCVERFNRTYNNLVLHDGPFDNIEQVRNLSQCTIDFLNRCCPSRAGSCQGLAPLIAHPTAQQPRRLYQPECEHELFDLRRVDSYLAGFGWQRRTDMVGKVSLANHDYYVGKANKGRVFDVSFDPTDRSFCLKTPDGEVELRRPAVGLDAQHLTNIRKNPRGG
jgi:transposase InsO family protein